MTKRINITESQLNRVNLGTPEPEWRLKYDIDKVDGGDKTIAEIVSNLSREELDEAFLDYRYIFKTPTYDNPLTLYMPYKLMNEGLIRTYPIEKTLSYIKDYFNYQDWQIKILETSNGIDFIRVYAPYTKENLKKLNKAMNLCGYFLSYPKLDNLDGVDEGVIVSFDFEGKFQEDDSDSIRSEERYLFHLTPRYYRKKIETIGISPKSKNSVFDYPDRVYFIRGTTPNEHFFDLAYKISSNNNSYLNRQERYRGKYTLFMIDVAKLPNTVRLYVDPKFDYGVYTTSYIDPICIVDVKDVEL